jgi:hypothetical protein
VIDRREARRHVRIEAADGQVDLVRAPGMAVGEGRAAAPAEIALHSGGGRKARR